ncbi:MAG: hypothetical protein R3D53_09370 [Paracoccaceae bacterium]
MPPVGAEVQELDWSAATGTCAFIRLHLLSVVIPAGHRRPDRRGG